MAASIYLPNSPEAVQLWSKKLFIETVHDTVVDKFIGDTADDMIVMRDETKNQGSGKVTVTLRRKLSGAGTLGDGVLEGAEENLSTQVDTMIIDQLRHAVLTGGNMSQQRITWDQREEAKSGLVDWWAQRIDTSLLNQLAGNSGITDLRYTGLQSPLPPSSFTAGGFLQPATQTNSGGNSAIAAEAELYSNYRTSTAYNGGPAITDGVEDGGFRLNLIDRLVASAESRSRPIRPIKLKGMSVYVLFLHPNQILQLRKNIGSNGWMDIQKAAMNGGQITNSPIFTGAVGMYNKTVIHQDARVPWGTQAQNPDFGTWLASTSVARGVFCGAQAGAISFGRAYGAVNKFTWVEQLKDYNNSLGVSAGLIWGAKKLQFGSTDFATITVSTYSPAPVI